MPFDRAGKAFAFRCSDNIDDFAFGEDIDGNRVSKLLLRRVSQTQFSDESNRLDICFGKMSFLRFGNFLIFNNANPDLYRVVSVALHTLDLSHKIRAGFNYRNRNYFAVFGEDLRHTDFFA